MNSLETRIFLLSPTFKGKTKRCNLEKLQCIYKVNFFIYIYILVDIEYLLFFRYLLLYILNPLTKNSSFDAVGIPVLEAIYQLH